MSTTHNGTPRHIARQERRHRDLGDYPELQPSSNDDNGSLETGSRPVDVSSILPETPERQKLNIKRRRR